MLFNSFDKKLKDIIGQGNQRQYRKLMKKIVKYHREEYLEENLLTAEDFIIELVDDALTEQYLEEGCVRDSTILKQFVDKLDNK